MFTAAQLGKLHKHAVNVIVNVWFPSVPVYSSGRRWRGWCASATKTLSSSHVLKPLVPVLCLSVVVIYGLADRLRNFVSGIFIPQYHYPYAVALCFGQVGACCPARFNSRSNLYESIKSKSKSEQCSPAIGTCAKNNPVYYDWAAVYTEHCVSWQQGICLCHDYICLHCISAATWGKVTRQLVCSHWRPMFTYLIYINIKTITLYISEHTSTMN